MVNGMPPCPRILGKGDALQTSEAKGSRDRNCPTVTAFTKSRADFSSKTVSELPAEHYLDVNQDIVPKASALVRLLPGLKTFDQRDRKFAKTDNNEKRVVNIVKKHI